MSRILAQGAPLIVERNVLSGKKISQRTVARAVLQTSLGERTLCPCIAPRIAPPFRMPKATQKPQSLKHSPKVAPSGLHQ
eukprot:8015259-Alexandrium_andersonii.AAC.1